MNNFLRANIYLTLVISKGFKLFFDETNKKVIGEMKDESEGKLTSFWIKVKDVFHERY